MQAVTLAADLGRFALKYNLQQQQELLQRAVCLKYLQPGALQLILECHTVATCRRSVAQLLGDRPPHQLLLLRHLGVLLQAHTRTTTTSSSSSSVSQTYCSGTMQ